MKKNPSPFSEVSDLRLYRPSLLPTPVAVAALLSIGCGSLDSKWSCGPQANVVQSVVAGPDLNVDAGTAKCSFSGYAWTCETCNVVEVPIGSSAVISGQAVNHEWISPTNAATFSEPKQILTVANFSPGAPPQAGCITPTYPVELRVLDSNGVLHSDRFTVTLSCCGS